MSIELLQKLRRLAEETEREILRELNEEYSFEGSLDFAYFDHRWQYTPQNVLVVVSQGLAGGASSSRELDAAASYVGVRRAERLTQEVPTAKHRLVRVGWVDTPDNDIWYVLQNSLFGLRPPGSYAEGW